MSPKPDMYALMIPGVIHRLKKYKNNKIRVEKLSWDGVSQKLGIPKRTMLRWVKTKKMNPGYARLVDSLLRKLGS